MDTCFRAASGPVGLETLTNTKKEVGMSEQFIKITILSRLKQKFDLYNVMCMERISSLACTERHETRLQGLLDLLFTEAHTTNIVECILNQVLGCITSPSPVAPTGSDMNKQLSSSLKITSNPSINSSMLHAKTPGHKT